MPRKKQPGSIKVCLKNGRPIKDEAGRKKFDLQYYVGKSKRHKKLYFKTKREAEEFIAQERGEKEKGKTWSYVLAEWMRSTTSSEGYQEQVERSVRLIVKRLGDIDIQLTAAVDMRDYLKWRQDTTSAAAATKDLRHFLSIARWARGQIIIKAIPWEHIGKPSYKPAKRSAIPVDRIPDLLGDLDVWTRPITEWIAMTGMRQQEAANLEEKDIQPDRATVRIKGGDNIDYLIDPAMQAIIDRARQLKEAKGVKSYWLFCNSVGGRWTDQHLSHRIKEQWPDGVTLHCLRHSFATEAGRMFGADMVQAGLAHKSRATSERYSHVSEDAEARHTVGKAVRRVLCSADDSENAEHSQNTGTKTAGRARMAKDKSGRFEVMIGSHKLLITEEDAQEIIERYS